MRERARELRKHATDAETLLWRYLRGRRLNGHKFRRQVVVGAYIVDFVCVAQRLVIEVDGGQHADATAYDERRTSACGDGGYRVARYWNHEVLNQTALVLDDILRHLEHW